MNGGAFAIPYELGPSVCDTCPPSSPSLGWLSPRTSFSKEFSEYTHYCDGNCGHKHDSSLSEFEFSLSTTDCDGATDTQMLAAADDLFLEGKLLPLYAPRCIEDSEQPHLKQRGSNDVDCQQHCGHKSVDKVVALDPICSSEISHAPESPKTPRCVTRWRELFGVRKAKHQSLHDFQAKYAKPSWLQRQSSLPSRAMRLFCKPDNSKTSEVLISTEGMQRKVKTGETHDKVVIIGPPIPVISCQVRVDEKGHNETASHMHNRGVESIWDGRNKYVSPGCNLEEARPCHASSSRRGISCEETKLESYGHKDLTCHESSLSRSFGTSSPGGCLSPGWHSSVAWNGLGQDIFSPGRGTHNPECLSFQESTEGKRRLLRAGSLESSSSHSPQWKLHHLQVVRQRGGRRCLERSCSYNTGSMRVSPVLNVPAVCMMQPKHSIPMNGFGQWLFFTNVAKVNGNPWKKS